MRKTTLEQHCSCSVQKTAPRNTQYSRNENISKMAKIGHPAKGIAFEIRHFDQNIKIVKNIRKTTL